nr:hypothetical protein Iba_chr09bCG4240 [Ipomoea batatas]GMD35207.1 hypothetical protein Iba_chr09dCG4760 [Ipomoea batatas]GMD38554.1 hypothetical protein Iba_chr09fCG5090 [Ipomoea batatas]
MWLIGHQIRSLSSLIMSTCVVRVRQQIRKLFQTMFATFYTNTRFSLGSQQLLRLQQTLSDY